MFAKTPTLALFQLSTLMLALADPLQTVYYTKFDGTFSVKPDTTVDSQSGRKNIQGSFSIPLPDYVWGGWTVDIKFDKPVFNAQFHQSQLTTDDKDGSTHLVLTNADFNGNFDEGITFQDDFQAQVQDLPLSATVTLTPKVVNQPPQEPVIKTPAKSALEKYNYAEALELSIIFYETQRSGRLPANKRIPWRGDSGLTDAGENGEDLTGGWYDAGDHLKFGLPMAFSTTILSWGLLEYWNAYQQTGQLNAMLDCIKWPLDYFIKAHVKPDEFYAQVGDPAADHAYWGSPEKMNMPRPAYKVTCQNPGTEPVAETAAAMAAGYLAFKDNDPAYADELLLHAKQLYDFGMRCQGSYVDDGKVNAGCCYNSWSGYKDELAWAGAWMHFATGEPKYLEEAQEAYKDCCSNDFSSHRAFSWDHKGAGAALMLFKITGGDIYKEALTSYLNDWVDGTYPKKTPKGLSWFSAWGSNRYASSAAFLSLVAADLIPDKAVSYRTYAKTQIHYILGDCCLDPATKTPTFSYLAGFSTPGSPIAPHHRGASCTPAGRCVCNQRADFHRLYGALVGGPSADDTYNDSCSDYVHNEVATDYNAGFQSAVAGKNEY